MKGQFKIWVSRIETVPAKDAGDFAQVTFRIDTGSSSLDFPVLVKKGEFDDADLTKVARNILHESLVGLANQTEKWKLTEEELQQLSSWKFYQGA